MNRTRFVDKGVAAPRTREEDNAPCQRQSLAPTNAVGVNAVAKVLPTDAVAAAESIGLRLELRTDIQEAYTRLPYRAQSRTKGTQ